MVRAAYVDKNGVKKGAWSHEEDEKLTDYIVRYGHWNWRLLPKFAGLERCGKSCRLRWMNHLKPGVRRGNYTKEERDLIYRLHRQLGNKWSAIAEKFPGRSDNDVKNYWNTHHRKSNTSRKVPQHAESTQQSLQVVDCKNIFEGSFADSVDPKFCRRKIGKAKVSSDIFILESSSSGLSSSEASSTIDSDSTADNFHETLISDDLLSDFHENFWTQPFIVDTYSYNCGYSFPHFDDYAK